MRFHKRERFGLAVLTFFSLLGSGTNSFLKAQSEPKLRDPKTIAEGARLFAPTCGTGYCHGAGGSGGGAPKLRGRGLEAGFLFKTISNGVTRTPMMPFKSQYTEEQIWKLVAFIMSDPAASISAATPDQPSNPAAPEPPTTGAAVSALLGDPKSGRAIFFDTTVASNCSACHSFNGEGGSIAPDLSKPAELKSPRDMFASIVMPGSPRDSRYRTVVLTLRSGEKISGIVKEEDAESIRVYDTTELPAVLRTVQKQEVSKRETIDESSMPRDYSSRYTLKQLLDLVAFLKLQSQKEPVTLGSIIGKQ